MDTTTSTAYTYGMEKESPRAPAYSWTYDSVIKKFKEDFKDEINDSNTYLNMAKSLAKKETPDMSSYSEMEEHKDMIKGLYLMAHDEFTHARFIHHCLVDAGVTIHDDDDSAYRDLKKRIRHIFHGDEYN